MVFASASATFRHQWFEYWPQLFAMETQAQKLALFEAATVLSTISLEATVVFDDLTDKLDETPGLRQRLGLTEEELQECETVLRKILNRSANLRNDLRRELEAPAAVLRMNSDEGRRNQSDTDTAPQTHPPAGSADQLPDTEGPYPGAGRSEPKGAPPSQS